jgi:putative SOS response-associated peptidase YedK
MAPIHDRMPVIIDAADRRRWLDPAANGEAVGDLLRPCAEDALTGYDVSTRVNNVANDDDGCIEPHTPSPPEQRSLL